MNVETTLFASWDRCQLSTFHSCFRREIRQKVSCLSQCDTPSFDVNFNDFFQSFVQDLKCQISVDLLPSLILKWWQGRKWAVQIRFRWVRQGSFIFMKITWFSISVGQINSLNDRIKENRAKLGRSCITRWPKMVKIGSTSQKSYLCQILLQFFFYFSAQNLAEKTNFFNYFCLTIKHHPFPMT